MRLAERQLGLLGFWVMIKADCLFRICSCLFNIGTKWTMVPGI